MKRRTSIMGMTKEQFIGWCEIYWSRFKRHIRIGDWVEALIHTISLGYGERISLAIARVFGYNKCGCCERKQWLNRLTNPYYDGGCDKININLNDFPTYD
jgi:hypothetical protein